MFNTNTSNKHIFNLHHQLDLNKDNNASAYLERKNMISED